MKSKSVLTRYEGNPLFDPADFPYYRVEQIFNPGQVMTPDGRTILILSVLPMGASRPCCHVAESADGIHFTIRQEPCFTFENSAFQGYDGWPIDCRVTFFAEENCYYIIRPGNGADLGPAALLYRTVDFQEFEPIDIISLPSNRVPCLFPEKINGKYVRLDRPYSHGAPMAKAFANIWLSRSPDLIHWGENRVVLRRGCTRWASSKIGPTPPVRTDKGWLEIYHGVLDTFSGFRYCIGACLLDLEQPEKVLGVMKSYLLAPETEYELNGVIPNVVFTTGCVVAPESRELRIYYGASDTSIGLATGNVDEIVEMCLKGE